MNLRFLAQCGLLATVVVAPAFAQSAASSSDEEANLSLTLPTDEWYVPKNKVSFGYRMLSSGIKAKFGNLGSVASIRSVAAASEGDAARSYDNGYVTRDTYRAGEYDSSGNVTTTPGTRYQFYRSNSDGSQTLTYDYLAYTPGQSREWGYTKADQVTPGQLALSNYSSRSEGGRASKDEGMNGGIELNVSRDMGKLGSERFKWSLTAGLALNSMNAKTAGSVTSTLIRYTDFYRITDPSYVGVNSGTQPSYTPTYESDGTTVINEQGIETTVPISGAPIGSTTTEEAGGATVKGNWKVKGAYFLVRFGPQVRTQLTERFGISAGLGLAGAYAGSRYSVVEKLEIPDVREDITQEDEDATGKFIGGFYADMMLDYAATERTGIYAGMSVQSLGSYEQTVAGRTAKIDFGSALGIHGGLSYKF